MRTERERKFRYAKKIRKRNSEKNPPPPGSPYQIPVGVGGGEGYVDGLCSLKKNQRSRVITSKLTAYRCRVRTSQESVDSLRGGVEGRCAESLREKQSRKNPLRKSSPGLNVAVSDVGRCVGVSSD